MGRKAGALHRFTCVDCGAVELVKGGTANYQCPPCKVADNGLHPDKHETVLRGGGPSDEATSLHGPPDLLDRAPPLDFEWPLGLRIRRIDVVTRIKNWHQFQHFKDRRPPWVKLYRDLLDDLEWHELEPKAAKALVMLWLIASDNDGDLPDTKKLAFRLRMTESATIELLSKLSHWVEQGDIDVISDGYQSDRPEESREETEKRREEAERRFKIFYNAYPRKVAPDAARKAFDKRNVTDELLAQMIGAIEKQGLKAKCDAGEARFVCHPATWLNEGRWQDEESAGPAWAGSLGGSNGVAL